MPLGHLQEQNISILFLKSLHNIILFNSPLQKLDPTLTNKNILEHIYWLNDSTYSFWG